MTNKKPVFFDFALPNRIISYSTDVLYIVYTLSVSYVFFTGIL